MKLSNLTNSLWWKDAAVRATYTALAIALPYLGASLLTEVPWVTVLLTAALGFLASIVTSLAGLPEVEGVHLPWWLAALERVVKTFAQSLAAGFIGATLITDVDWAFVLQAAFLAALTSLVRLILATLPADPSRTPLDAGEAKAGTVVNITTLATPSEIEATVADAVAAQKRRYLRGD
ncbi:holin [Microbacterium sp. IEGM 1404]|uniref:holin n=1 Tax=Microbacterium sp. IEGM 1404 TaxID=3047084 RepID=UPI0024B78096|nr:holin [Microbacterium sp. IEGM 1404]MDI9889987.1 holin [Microbacterium sp. IEGM 1404]